MVIVGTEQITTITDMPIYFQRALASSLASRIIIPLTGDVKMFTQIGRLLAQDIQNAKMRNAEERWQTIEHDSWWDGDR